MAGEPNVYRRLPGLGSSAFEHVRLYLASDHLLLVSSSGYVETYKRFYFCDIQSLTLCQTVHGKIWNGVWGFLLGVFGIVALQTNLPAAAVWWAVAAVFLLLLLVNVARGPTCVGQIQTAVQIRPLASLNRLRAARKVIAQLKPLIENAQAAVP